MSSNEIPVDPRVGMSSNDVQVAATAPLLEQSPENATATPTPTKTTTWQTFSVFIMWVWLYVSEVWASCRARWFAMDLTQWKAWIGARFDRFGTKVRTCSRTLALTLNQVKSCFNIRAIRDGLRVPPRLRVLGSLADIQALGSRTWTMGWSRGFVIGIVVAVMAVFGFDILQSGFRSAADTSLSWTQQRRCYQILRPFNDIKRFPLPLPVDEATHEAILNAIGRTESRQLLPSLSSEIHFVRSDLSELVKEGQDLSQRLAYAYSTRDGTNQNLIGKANDLLRRFDSTATPIKVSINLYDFLEVLYYQQQHTAKVALEHSYLGLPSQQTLVKYQPSALEKLGITFDKWYGQSLHERRKTWEEARLGVAALTRESQRLKQIGYLIAEGRRILDLLTTSLMLDLMLEGAQCKENICRQESARQWRRLAMVDNARLGEVWRDVSASITDGEESLPIDISVDLCDRDLHR